LQTKLWLGVLLALTVSSAFAADVTVTPPVEVKKTPQEIAADKEIAQTFKGEAKGSTVAIYSNSKKERFCELYVKFSSTLNGKREIGESRCFEKTIPAGRHVLVCEVTNPDLFIDPKIEGEVGGTCK
jgi:hypothetical protein